MFCKNCGSELKEGILFCGGCGTKCGETDSAAPVNPVPIATVTEETQAHSQPSPTAPPPQPSQPSSQPPPVAPEPKTTAPAAKKPTAKKKPVALICIIAVIAIALGAGAYFFFFHGDNDDSGDGISGPRAIPNEARMMMELSQDGRSIIPREQTVTNVEILDYETNRDEWTHFAAVLVNSEDNEVAYTKYANMLYYRDEEREWVLLAIEPDRTDLWLMSPLVGVNTDVIEDAARNVLNRQQITIDGDEWFIDADTIENVTISNQNTDLNNRRDAATATVVLGSEAMTAQGQIELSFTFDGGWFFENYSALTPFTSEYRPNAVFELSAEQLLDELVRHDATTLREMVFERDTITLSRDEISNLSISDYESSNRGANRIYNFSFTVEKGIITYEVDAQAFYHFDGMSGWMISDDTGFSFSPTVASVDLAGTIWTGTTRINAGHASLTQNVLNLVINEVTAAGAVRATITALSPEMSFSAVGAFDMNSRSLSLNFDEWIVEPEDKPWNVFGGYGLDTAGHLGIDGTTITTSGQGGTSFDVTLTDEVPEPDPDPGDPEDEDESDDE